MPAFTALFCGRDWPGECCRGRYWRRERDSNRRYAYTMISADLVGATAREQRQGVMARKHDALAIARNRARVDWMVRRLKHGLPRQRRTCGPYSFRTAVDELR